MANFVVVVDPEDARRTQFVNAVRPLVAPVARLRAGECACGPFHALWASKHRAPVDHSSGESHAAVIIGRAFPRDGVRPVAADTVHDSWGAVSEATPDAWDGYFAAVAYDRVNGLVLGGDLLGYFPLYWWSSGGVTLAGSSPELFRHHPQFAVALDLTGLVGILLTMHSVGGRTLLKGVHRLTHGHLLRALPGGKVSELCQYRMPYSTKYYDWPFAEHLNIIEDAIDHCMRRQLVDGPTGILLSGGLDSRLIAGFLARNGIPATALTFGVEGDFEARCARGVANALRFEHRVSEVDLEPAIYCAEQHARWCHLASGFSSIEYWNARAHVDRLPPVFAAGYALDTCMAAGYTGRSYSPETRTMSWDNYSRHVFAWGLGVDRLRRLLREEVFRDALDENLELLRHTYDGYSEYPSKCHWMFGMVHRGRFHIGQMPWMFSFSSWPMLVVLDHGFLDAIGGLPPATVGQRHAQFELIKSRFPVLARLPLDRNSFNRLPIEPSWRHLLAHRIELRAQPWLAHIPTPRRERRYYHRVYSLDSPGWRAIREHAAPHFQKLHALFHREVLDEYLPPPRTTIPTTDIFAESSGRKLLLGLALWAREYL